MAGVSGWPAQVRLPFVAMSKFELSSTAYREPSALQAAVNQGTHCSWYSHCAAHGLRLAASCKSFPGALMVLV